jgi:hypothetical protein
MLNSTRARAPVVVLWVWGPDAGALDMGGAQGGVAPLEACVRVLLAPLKVHGEEGAVLGVPELLDRRGLASAHAKLLRGEDGGRERRVELLVEGEVRYLAHVPLLVLERADFDLSCVLPQTRACTKEGSSRGRTMLSTIGSVSPNLRNATAIDQSIFATAGIPGFQATDLVRTILIKAVMALVLVTMCALAV